MTDQELLELAAKAAGYETRSDGEGALTLTVRPGVCRPWDPLEDDGDNYRLATALDISVIIAPNTVFAVSYNNCCVQEEFDSQGGVSIRFDKEPSGVVHYMTPEKKPAAVRRAVVLAAATQAPRRRIAV